MDSNITTTAVGWGVVLAVGSAAFLYYNQRGGQRPGRLRASRAAPVPTSHEPQRSRALRPDDRRNAANLSDNLSSNSASAKPRPKKPASELPRPAPHPSADDDAEDDDLSWATELAKRKKGTPLSAPKKAESRQKTVTQSSANKVAAELSADTSTTGADADDDMSPSASPHLSSSDAVAVAGDFDDMLEAPASGPSVLRLTEPEFRAAPRQNNFKPPKPEETKKQRQNKRKNEEKKAQREEDETARRAALEKQRRTAREARGEPARNGLAPPPATNAWATKAASKVAGAVNGVAVAMLDTFSSKERENDEYWKHGDLPSEEEQMRILMETDDSAWKTVAKKTKSKRKNTAGESDDGAVQPVGGEGATAESKLLDESNGVSNGVH
jgi:hypothetical protein